jgi:hypothetical protein
VNGLFQHEHGVFHFDCGWIKNVSSGEICEISQVIAKYMFRNQQTTIPFATFGFLGNEIKK